MKFFLYPIIGSIVGCVLGILMFFVILIVITTFDPKYEINTRIFFVVDTVFITLGFLSGIAVWLCDD